MAKAHSIIGLIARFLTILLLLFLIAHPKAHAQAATPWTGTATASTSTVAAGASANLTVSITAGSSVAGAIAAVSIIDANGQYSPAVLKSTTLQAGQTLHFPVTDNITATAPNGTYTVVVSASDAAGNLLFKNTSAATFQVSGGTAPGPVQHQGPLCVPPSAMNSTLTLTPPLWSDWLAAPNPVWILTWYCPSSSSPSGFVGYLLTGYRSELLPNWSSLSGLSMGNIATLWQTNSFNDPELAPAANSQLAATAPDTLKTTSTTAYYVIQQPDKYVAVPVGTIQLGTVCNRSQSVDGMYGVPAASVTWYGAAHPLAVVSPCG